MARYGSVLLLVACCAFGPARVVAQSSDAPARIVLLVDSSSSVGPWVNDFRAGLNAFINELSGDDEIALITTGGTFRIRVQPTADRQVLRTAVAGFFPDGGANSLLESLLEADRRILKSDPTKWPVFVILTTDAGQTRTDPSLEPFNKFTRDFVGRRGNAYSIVIQGRETGLIADLAMNLARNTTGYYETMTLATSLPDQMKQIADLIALEYHPRLSATPLLGR